LCFLRTLVPLAHTRTWVIPGATACHRVRACWNHDFTASKSLRGSQSVYASEYTLVCIYTLTCTDGNGGIRPPVE